MTIENFNKILSTVWSDEQCHRILSEWEPNQYAGCPIFDGLNIIRKYCNGDFSLVHEARHKCVISHRMEDLVEWGIVEEDVEILSVLGWQNADGRLCCQPD